MVLLILRAGRAVVEGHLAIDAEGSLAGSAGQDVPAGALDALAAVGQAEHQLFVLVHVLADGHVGQPLPAGLVQQLLEVEQADPPPALGAARWELGLVTEYCQDRLCDTGCAEPVLA